VSTMRTNIDKNVVADTAFSVAGRPPFVGPRKHRGNPHYHSFCPHCCHPAHACCCGAPQCRKEAKEVVVMPEVKARDKAIVNIHRMAASILSMQPSAETPEESAGAETASSVLRMQALDEKTLARTGLGMATAFIGGGCCVHLSAEYMPAGATTSQNGIIVVAVTDSGGTVLAWAQVVGAQSGYHIKENIITTNPGAKLLVYAVNTMARVRWCEIFSC
jgi:hypothetical protein